MISFRSSTLSTCVGSVIFQALSFPNPKTSRQARGTIYARAIPHPLLAACSTAHAGVAPRPHPLHAHNITAHIIAAKDPSPSLNLPNARVALVTSARAGVRAKARVKAKG